MALPVITKIFYRSDFTVQLPLADGYDGQEFRFTLYTCGEPENGWVASYIDGVYTNCTVEGDIVVIYVNNNNRMNPGCLTVQSEYDYFNSHFRDNEDNVKDTYKTNIYLVAYRTNAFSAEFKPSVLPDLSNVSEYVTFTDLEAMSYATTTYVADYVATYGGNVDLSAYVTKTELQEDLNAYVTKEELNEAGYLTSVPSNYATKGYVAQKANEVKADTYSYVVDYVSTYAPTVDLSAYAKKSDLNAYVSKEELNAAGYVTSSVLDGYVTDTELDIALDDYATKSYVVDYVATYGGNVDLSSYVTKDELNQAGYLTSIPSEYVTDSELNSTLSSYITESELDNMSYADKAYVANYVATYGGNVDLSSYATKSYVAEYVATYAPEPDLSSYAKKSDLNSYATKTYVADYVNTHSGSVDLSAYVTKDELNAASYITQTILSNAGYITSIPSEYITDTELSAIGYSKVIEISEEDYELLSYAEKTNGYIYVITDSYYEFDPTYFVSKTELNNASYATQTYVADYVAQHAPTPDLSAYVTKTELNNAGYISSIPSDYATYDAISQMGYLTSIPSEYITQDELSANAYLTQHQDLSSYVKLADLDSYVSKTELSNAGYITSIPSDYATYDAISQMGYITSIPSDYATYDAISQMGYITSIPSEYITQAELSSNAYLTQHQDLSTYATKSYVSTYYPTYAAISAMSYISYVSFDASTYTLTISI